MRISKEISGRADERDTRAAQGRGEYEFCELTQQDPTADELFGRRILIKLPDGRHIDTGCIFSNQGGKRRIRAAEGVVAREVYPIWHAAALLILPRPNRDQNSWGEGEPVLRNSQYGISHLHMRRVDLIDDTHASLEIERVDVANHYSEESILFDARYSQVQLVWAKRDQFDQDVIDLLVEHEELVNQGEPLLGPRGGRIVTELQRLIAETSADYGISATSPTMDVLPALLQIIDAKPIPQPPSIDAVPPEEDVIRRRDVKQWRQWAVRRGAESFRFRRSVRNAYRSICFVCGLQLPNIGNGSNPGVDAAHILPWSSFDLDTVSNGICLCKLHHWAFDEGLLQIEHDGTNYSVIVPQQAIERINASGVEFSIDFLHQSTGPIPVERLPHRVADRPNPDFLRMLREASTTSD